MRKRKDKIVFLDTATIDFGDVSFSKFEKLGNFIMYPHTDSTKILERIRDADIVITNKCVFNHKILSKAENLKLLAVSATGTNNVDLELAKHYGVGVANARNYCSDIMAQYTMTFILTLAGDLKKLSRQAIDGTWSRSKHFTVVPSNVMQLRGKTLGVIGYGSIGRKVVKLARCFGMKVLIAKLPKRRYFGNLRRTGLNTLLRGSDFISIHVPLTAETKNLIDEENLRKIRACSFIINTSRGGIVNEKALAKALKKGKLSGAALDVLAQEPPSKSHLLMKTPNLILTPHAAWASIESRMGLLHEVQLNIKAFQQKRLRNRVA